MGKYLNGKEASDAQVRGFITLQQEIATPTAPAEGLGGLVYVKTGTQDLCYIADGVPETIIVGGSGILCDVVASSAAVYPVILIASSGTPLITLVADTPGVLITE